jgi:hypothetical protein
VYDRIARLEVDAATSKVEAIRLETKADMGYANLPSQIGALSTRMDKEFEKVDKKFDRFQSRMFFAVGNLLRTCYICLTV